MQVPWQFNQAICPFSLERRAVRRNMEESINSEESNVDAKARLLQSFSYLTRHPLENSIYILVCLTIMIHAYLPVPIPDLAKVLSENRTRTWDEEISIWLNLITLMVFIYSIVSLSCPRRHAGVIRALSCFCDTLLILVFLGAAVRIIRMFCHLVVFVDFLILLAVVAVFAFFMNLRLFRCDRN